MPRSTLLVSAAFALAACGERAAPTTPTPAPPTPPAAPSAGPVVTPAADPGPADLVRSYFKRVQAKDFAEAWSMWGNGGQASGMTEAAFARSFDRYETFTADVGGPGPIEGAAGSLYVEVPVRVRGLLKTGRPFSMEGPIRLRRVNNVPGATPAQLRWHIVESEVRARPEESSQNFWVGRWAAKPDLCEGGAWNFTIGGVSTAGEVSCTFDRIRDVAVGVEIDATCTAQAPPERHKLTLSYAESAKALLVGGGPFADVGLTRCP